MRFSVFQYSQEKLLEHSLDVTDALILSWFSDFFMTGMEKKVFKEHSESNGITENKLYGWVKLSKVLEDIPCIGINSEKGIKRRFDGFVEKGIMTRQSIITQNGKKTYYRPTEIYDGLINSKTSRPEKSGKTKTENPPEENQKEQIPQGYSDSHAKTESPQGTKTTYAESESTQENPQGYFNSHAQRNGNILAQGHSDSHALNDYPTRNYFTKDADAARMQDEIKNLSENIFGKNAFDPAFPKKAAAFFESKNVSKNEIQKYFEFIKIRTDSKNASNPRGLAYRLIFQDDILQEFLDKQAELQNQAQAETERQLRIEAQKITCPACGSRFLQNYGDECPDCCFQIKDFGDTSAIRKHKKFIRLSESERQNYCTELLSFKSDLTFMQRAIYIKTAEGQKEKAQFILALDKKYRLLE